MLVVCPKCGAKNRIPGTTESGKVYRCGKCSTTLTVTSKAVRSRDTSQEPRDFFPSFFSSDRFQRIVVAIFVLLFLFTTSSLVFKHFVFQTSAYDTGIEAGVARNIVFNHSFYDSVKDEHLLGDHFEPALAVPGVLFKIWDNAAVALIFQNLCAFASILLAYFLAKRILKSRPAALLLAALYTFNFYLHMANDFEFHIEFLGLPLFFILLLLIEREKRSYLTFLLLVLVSMAILLVKEDLALVLGIFGLWAFLFKKDKRPEGLAMFFIGIAGFFVIVVYVIPYFSGGEHHYIDRYSNLGSTPQEIVRVLFTRPDIVITNLMTPGDKIVSLILLLGSFLFLPLLALTYLLSGFAGLFYNLISNYEAQYHFGYQYSVPTLPFLFYASVYGFRRLENLIIRWRTRFNALPNVVLGCIVLMIIIFAGLFVFTYEHHYTRYEDLRVYSSLAQDIKPRISKDSRVFTVTELNPHFIEYAYAGVFFSFSDFDPSELEGEYYVVMFVDRTPHSWNEDSYKSDLARLREDLIEVYQNDHFLVLKSY